MSKKKRFKKVVRTTGNFNDFQGGWIYSWLFGSGATLVAYDRVGVYGGVFVFLLMFVWVAAALYVNREVYWEEVVDE